MRLLDLVLDGIFFVVYIMGSEIVEQLCTCCTVVEMSCFCLEYVDVNKCNLQFCLCRYVSVANGAYCCEANPSAQNFKLFFPVFC